MIILTLVGFSSRLMQSSLALKFIDQKMESYYYFEDIDDLATLAAPTTTFSRYSLSLKLKLLWMLNIRRRI